MPIMAGSGKAEASIMCGNLAMTNTEYSPGPAGRKRRLVGWRIAAWTGAGLILLLPLIAMQFSKEVQWTAFDFLAAGVMLAALVGAFELAVRLSDDWLYRGGVALAAVGGFLMLWVQGAVGLVGSENSPFGLLVLAPLAVGVVGALWSRFRARGLSRTLWVMAAMQAIVVAVAYAVTRDGDAFLLCVWVGIWALSAGLVGRAARR
jgi:hypothetical protein